MQVTVLGSGTALPTPRRASAGYLVEWDGHALLLDPSAGTLARALKAGLAHDRLRGVALTHLHPDHCADLPAILFARRQLGAAARMLHIAGPDGTAAFLHRCNDAFGGVLGTPAVVRPYPFELDGLAVTGHLAVHGPDAFCLRLEAGGRVLAFSGDTEECDGLLDAARGAHLLLLECTAPEPRPGHLDPAAAARVAAASGAERVLLTHLGPDVRTDLPQAEDGTVAAV